MKKYLKILDRKNSINVKNDFASDNLIDSYIPTKENITLLTNMIELTRENNNGSKSFLISGSYGTGKSYFLSVFLNILSKGITRERTPKLYSNLIGHFRDEENMDKFDEIYGKVDSKKTLVVFLDSSEKSFFKALEKGVYRALKDNSINDFKLATEGNLAVNQIEVWEKDYKSTFDIFKSLISEKENFDEFISDLRNNSEKSIVRFKEIYINIFAGIDFNPLNVINNIEDFLLNFEKNLLKTSGYNKIIYVFDEFGRYLETNIENIDVKEVQDMSEYCNDENNSFMFLITHQSMFLYADKLIKKKHKQEWEKVAGRFKKINFRLKKENINTIITNILTKDKEEYGVYKKLESLNFDKYYWAMENSKVELSNSKRLPKRELINSVIDNYFPLNYFTAQVLPGISEKLAQNERTLFAFLGGSEKYSLSYFLNTGDFQVTLDYLYDFFESNFKFLEEDTFEKRVYIHCKSALKKLNSKEKLLERIIKSIALLCIYNNFGEVPPCLETLRGCFIDDEFEEAIELLFEKNIITKQYSTGYILLSSDSEVNIKYEVKNKEESLIKPVETLNKYFNKGIYYPLSYNEEFKIIRYFSTRFIDISEINKLNDLEVNEDGEIVYVLNLYNDEEYVEKLEELGLDKNPRILVYNKKGIQLEIQELLREFLAIESLLKTDIRFMEKPIFKEEAISFKNDVYDAINNEIDKFFKFEETMIKTEEVIVENNTRENLLKVTYELLVKRYYKFKAFNNELINKKTITGTSKISRRSILTKIFEKYEFEDSYFNNTGAENFIARTILKNTSIFSNGKIDIWNENNQFKDLFVEIKEELKTKQTFEALIKKYCSSEGNHGYKNAFFYFILLILIFAEYETYSLYHEDSTGNSHEQNITVDLIDLIEKDSKKYSIVSSNVSEEEINYMNQLLELFNKYQDEDCYDKVSTRVLKAMRNYFNSLPRIATDEYLQNMKKFKKILGDINSITNADEFVRIQIVNRYTGKDRDLNNTVSLINDDFIELNNKVERMEIEIEDTLRGVLICEELNSYSLRNWKENTSMLTSDLHIWLSKYNYSTNTKFIRDFTAKVMGFDYYNWRKSLDIDTFKERVREAFENKLDTIKSVEMEENRAASLSKSISKEEILLHSHDKEVRIKIKPEDEKLSPHGSILKTKLMADIKNMGLTIKSEEKKRILLELLMDTI